MGILRQDHLPSHRGSEKACVLPISPSVRNLSASPDSRRSLLGVEANESAPRRVTLSVPRVGEEGGEVTTVTGVPPPEDEEVEEGRAPKTRESPTSMTPEEFRVHSLTHIPYHPGCRCCVAARKRDHKHPRRHLGNAGTSSGCAEEEAPLGASLCADYFFPRDKPGEESVTALAICDITSQFLAAHIVDAKGASANSAVRQVLRDLRKMGHYGDIKVRSDQESSIADLFRAVAK